MQQLDRHLPSLKMTVFLILVIELIRLFLIVHTFPVPVITQPQKPCSDFSRTYERRFT